MAGVTACPFLSYICMSLNTTIMSTDKVYLNGYWPIHLASLKPIMVRIDNELDLESKIKVFDDDDVDLIHWLDVGYDPSDCCFYSVRMLGRYAEVILEFHGQYDDGEWFKHSLYFTCDAKDYDIFPQL